MLRMGRDELQQRLCQVFEVVFLDKVIAIPDGRVRFTGRTRNVLPKNRIKAAKRWITVAMRRQHGFGPLLQYIPRRLYLSECPFPVSVPSLVECPFPVSLPWLSVPSLVEKL